jgi:hypothetical protein
MDSVIPMMLGCGNSELDWHLVQTYFVFLFGRSQGRAMTVPDLLK